MGRFGVVVLLPEPADGEPRMDFVGREFDDWAEVPGLMAELERVHPGWRLVSFCHVEDLPLLCEPPPDPTAVDPN